MSCVDLHSQFLSYCPTTSQHSESNWSQSQFLQTCNRALTDVIELQEKIKYLELERKSYNHSKNIKQERAQKLSNVHNSIKLCENQAKKISSMNVDLKTSSSRFSEDFKNSIVSTLELKIMEAGLKFKKIYKNTMNEGNKRSSDSRDKNSENTTPAINLGRSHFLVQTQQQIMEETAVNQYKDIQKSINQISQMYKETMSVVRIHQLLVDSISGNIDQTDMNVDGGKKHLMQASHRQAKNRKLIYKIFAVLYITATIYIVFLS